MRRAKIFSTGEKSDIKTTLLRQKHLTDSIPNNMSATKNTMGRVKTDA
ncbi:MAG: hypothetical protein WCJ49_04070 [Deltaproteobacteria bacterium]